MCRFGNHKIGRRVAVKVLATALLEGENPHRASWLRTRQPGLMLNYLAPPSASPDAWNRRVDSFDINALLSQLEQLETRYIFFTLGGNSGYYSAPNPEYDRIVGFRPSHCSRRDLVAELAETLDRNNIRLVLYLPSGAPDLDHVACRKLKWTPGPARNAEFQESWQKIISEWSKRYGGKLAGWWFDGCYWPNIMYRGPKPNFASFATAARIGNPQRIIAFNTGTSSSGYSPCPQADFTAGETKHLDRTIPNNSSGFVDGAQLHRLTHLGENWGNGRPRFSTSELASWIAYIHNRNGAVTLDVEIGYDGAISKDHFAYLNILQKVDVGRG